jgi:hypothetical protein
MLPNVTSGPDGVLADPAQSYVDDYHADWRTLFNLMAKVDSQTEYNIYMDNEPPVELVRFVARIFCIDPDRDNRVS